MKICIACKIEFLTHRTTPYQKYCSIKCRNAYWNKEVSLNGKKKGYQAKYRRTHTDYLKVVNLEYKDRTRFSDGSGSKSLNRKATLERDSYTCQKCGCNEYKKLIVHHNTYPATVENLITLCRSCHFTVHLILGGKFYPARNEGLTALTV